MAPLREPTYFILAALLDGPLHGYGVAQRAGELSGGRVKLTAGTLYGAFDRLAAEGLVEADREEVVEGRKRRYYRLTEEGNERLRDEAQRMRESAAVVFRVVPA
jgi:DNA-binding PadR family transcriptional regulator